MCSEAVRYARVRLRRELLRPCLLALLGAPAEHLAVGRLPLRELPLCRGAMTELVGIDFRRIFPVAGDRLAASS